MLNSRRRAADEERRGARNSADGKFRAFSDSTRLRILHLLQAGELCVGDLVKVIQVPQPTASRHLAYLRRSGWSLRARTAKCEGLLRSRPSKNDLSHEAHGVPQSLF